MTTVMTSVIPDHSESERPFRESWLFTALLEVEYRGERETANVQDFDRKNGKWAELRHYLRLLLRHLPRSSGRTQLPIQSESLIYNQDIRIALLIAI